MSAHVDGAAPSVAPVPGEGEPHAGSSPGPDAGSDWVRAEMQRRMAANRSTRGRHARRGEVATPAPPGTGPGTSGHGGRPDERRRPDPARSRGTVPTSAADLPENYVPRHSVQTPGPAAEPAAPISGSFPVVPPLDGPGGGARTGGQDPRGGSSDGPVGGPSLTAAGLPIRRRRGSGPGTPLQAGSAPAPGPWSRPGPVVPHAPARRLGAPPEMLGSPEPIPSWGLPLASPPRGFAVPGRPAGAGPGAPVAETEPTAPAPEPTTRARSAATGATEVADGPDTDAGVGPGEAAGPTGRAAATSDDPADATAPEGAADGAAAGDAAAEGAGTAGAVTDAAAADGTVVDGTVVDGTGPADATDGRDAAPSGEAGQTGPDAAPTDGPAPTDGAVPTDGAAPSDGPASTNGAAPSDGPASTNGAAPTDGPASTAASAAPAVSAAAGGAPATPVRGTATVVSPAGGRATRVAAPDETDAETTDEITDALSRRAGDTPTAPRPVVRGRRAAVSGRTVGVPAPRSAEPTRAAASRTATPRNIAVVGTAPPEPGSTRVRVVLAERKGVARAVRTIKEVQEGTAVGDLLRRDLIRSQLLVSLRFALLIVVVLGTLPALFTLMPEVGQAEVLGMRVPWVLLGVLMYPFLVGVALRYAQMADRVEQNFADHVQD